MCRRTHGEALRLTVRLSSLKSFVCLGFCGKLNRRQAANSLDNLSLFTTLPTAGVCTVQPPKKREPTKQAFFSVHTGQCGGRGSGQVLVQVWVVGVTLEVLARDEVLDALLDLRRGGSR